MEKNNGKKHYELLKLVAIHITYKSEKKDWLLQQFR